MAVTADIKFDQASGASDIAGRALRGVISGVPASDLVTVTNGDNTNVESWELELLYSPPGSALVPGVFASGVSATPSGTLAVDVRGCYRVQSTVRDAGGSPDVDIRNFGIPNFRGQVIPPYQKNPDPIDLDLKADELNFNGQPFGWAGDRVEGLLETYFTIFEDLFPVTVTSTPFTATADEANLYLVDTTVIGGASVFNLPGGARDGQVFPVKDNQNDAFSNPITLTLPGSDQFEDGSTTRVIFANGGLISVMKLTGVSWRVIQNTNREEWIELFSGQDSTSNTAGFDRVATKNFNPDGFPLSSVFIFEAIMETTIASSPHAVQLFNITLSSPVSTPLGSISLTPEVQSDNLLSPGDLAAGDNVYEVQHQMTAGAGPDEVTISGAHLRIVYSSTG